MASRMLIITVALLGAPFAFAAEPARPAGPAGPAKPVPFDVHGGYFVSNKFEPDAPASFVVLLDPVAFDQVFGSAFTMRDKQNRLPKNAFDTRMVLAAIKRGKAMVEYKVQEVAAEGGVLTIRYAAASTPQQGASFACPLIVSIPRGDYEAVQFIENDKPVMKVELKPRAALEVEPREPGTVQVTAGEKRTILSIKGGRGIGAATVKRTGDRWPDPLILRAYLRGLEQLRIAGGGVEVIASVSSHDGNPTRLSLKKDGKTTGELAKEHPCWMEIRVLGAEGKPAKGLPEQGGYFEMAIPRGLLADDAKSISLEWIDFYR